jgi:hypothetical protein
MSSETRSVWLGFVRNGGRFRISLDSVKDGIAILGQGANELAALVAYACQEAGLRTLVLDLDGKVSDGLSGYLKEYRAPHFLYDALRVEENPSTHAQLIASAYASALDLSFEQEASLNSIAQIVANEQGVASPASLADLIQAPESSKGRAVDRLRVRLETLRSLNLVGQTGVMKQVLGESAVLNFGGAGSPEVHETEVALAIAKLLALLGSEGVARPDVVVVTDANRLFKARPVFRKSQRFLTAFVSAPLPKVLASDAAYGLDEDYLDTCSTRILSSAAWNAAGRGDLVLTPNMFMFQNPSYGHSEVFVPRSFEARKGEPGTAQEPQSATAGEDSKMGLRILEEIAGFDGATRASIIGYLSSEFQKDELERTFDRLQSEGYLFAASKERAGSGRTVHSLSLTEKGRAALESQPR